ncbi:MAG TPA: class I SAM-dependent methyltransferase [Polyangiaceae bacterium]|nr:class I SAM-dependent methyltransferase [Polyangiaceae bacterium]
MSSKKPQIETNASILEKAMVRRLPRRTSAGGQLVWPAVPSLVDHYLKNLAAIFAAIGRAFSEEELAVVRGMLVKHIELAFAASPFSKVVIEYHTQAPPSTALNYTVSHRFVTLQDEYAGWVDNRPAPLFGANADAKLMALARSLGEPKDVPVLDVGAGTGRNTLPLAAAGFPTDAVELAPALAAVLREEVTKASPNVRVFEGDALDPSIGLPVRHYRVAVLAEVVASHFRTPAQIRTLFERALEWLAPGGLLLFSAFLTRGGYKPDAMARQLSEVMWCCAFTRNQLDEAAAGLPLTRISDESAHDYEKEHLPESAWPPTGWYAEWSRGQDLFDVPGDRTPLDLRWLVYRVDG